MVVLFLSSNPLHRLPQLCFSSFKLHHHCYCLESESEVIQLCLTLWDPMDCSLPGSSIHGIFQARILEWVTISFSRSSRPRVWTWVSRTIGRHFTIWATSPVFTSEDPDLELYEHLPNDHLPLTLNYKTYPFQSHQIHLSANQILKCYTFALHEWLPSAYSRDAQGTANGLQMSQDIDPLSSQESLVGPGASGTSSRSLLTMNSFVLHFMTYFSIIILLYIFYC